MPTFLLLKIFTLGWRYAEAYHRISAGRFATQKDIEEDGWFVLNGVARELNSIRNEENQLFNGLVEAIESAKNNGRIH